MLILTCGFPNGEYRTRLYEFSITEDSISIPGSYVGRDQIGEPTYGEQVDYLNQHFGNLLTYIGSGVWNIASMPAYEKIKAALLSVSYFSGTYFCETFNENKQQISEKRLILPTEMFVKSVRLQTFNYDLISKKTLTQKEENITIIGQTSHELEPGFLQLVFGITATHKSYFYLHLTEMTFESLTVEL